MKWRREVELVELLISEDDDPNEVGFQELIILYDDICSARKYQQIDMLSLTKYYVKHYIKNRKTIISYII